MTRTLVALTVGAVAAGSLAASAGAGPPVSRQQALQAVGDRQDSGAKGPEDTRSFGKVRCVRRGPSAFSCRGTLVKTSGSVTTQCELTYRVRKRGTRVVAGLVRRTCETRGGSGDGGSGGNGGGDGGIEMPGPRDPDNPFQEGAGPKYCPGTKGDGNWDATQDIVGKTYAEAVPIAQAKGCSVRIVRIDGEPQIVTSDLRYNRLNVEVEGPGQMIMAIESVA